MLSLTPFYAARKEKDPFLLFVETTGIGPDIAMLIKLPIRGSIPGHIDGKNARGKTFCHYRSASIADPQIKPTLILRLQRCVKCVCTGNELMEAQCDIRAETGRLHQPEYRLVQSSPILTLPKTVVFKRSDSKHFTQYTCSSMP